MNFRRPLFVLLACTAGATALAWWTGQLAHAPGLPTAAPERATPQPRIVSLMPPLTETLFEIGAGSMVVGRSDYCHFPSGVASTPSCGTALTPHHEAIVGLEPSLIVANASSATASAALRRLGPTELLPWLTAQEVIASTRRLGELSGRIQEANTLADALETELLTQPPPDAPRVLFVMLPEPGRLEPVSFLRRNSIHGRMLEAAGGRNAVETDVHHVPELSLEQVMAIDPDMILLLGIRQDLDEPLRARILDDWRRVTPLRAVQRGRIGILSGPHFYGAGSRLLQALEELRAELERLQR